MKKLLAGALTVFMAIGITACGEDGSPTGPKEALGFNGEFSSYGWDTAEHIFTDTVRSFDMNGDESTSVIETYLKLENSDLILNAAKGTVAWLFPHTITVHITELESGEELTYSQSYSDLDAYAEGTFEVIYTQQDRARVEFDFSYEGVIPFESIAGIGSHHGKNRLWLQIDGDRMMAEIELGAREDWQEIRDWLKVPYELVRR